MDIEQNFQKLVTLIEECGLIAKRYFDAQETDLEVKDDQSVVTRIDKEIEHILTTFVREHFPHDTIIGEEHGSHQGTSGFDWHIDPIDGTDNFVRKVPVCAISVARLGEAAGSFAVVHSPLTGQTISAIRETAGPVYEGEHIHAMTAETLGGRYVISLLRGRKGAWMKPAAYALQSALGMKFGKSTSYGSAALELAYIAANRIDAAVSFGLQSYDYAAGLFLVKAAGGAISVYENGAWQPWTGTLKELCSQHERTLLVSHPHIHPDLIDFIQNPKDWADRATMSLAHR